MHGSVVMDQQEYIKKLEQKIHRQKAEIQRLLEIDERRHKDCAYYSKWVRELKNKLSQYE